MTDDLTQRIQIALDLLAPQDDGCNHICSDNCIEGCKHICSDNCVEGCFIHGVICDMKREREQLQEQRDVAVRDLANYRSVVNGALLNQATNTAQSAVCVAPKPTSETQSTGK